MVKVAGIIFDFYGTLVEIDQEGPYLWMVLEALGFKGSPALEAVWSPDAFDGMETPRIQDSPSYDDWLYQNLCAMARQAGVPEKEVPPVVAQMRDADRSWTVKAKPGAVEVLDYLRGQGLPTAICSNWNSDIETYLRQASLPQLDAVVTSAWVGARKPHLRPFQVVCQALGVSPSTTLYVGDCWRTDVIGSLRVGLNPVWLTSSANPLPHLVRTIHRLEDLIPLLNG